MLPQLEAHPETPPFTGQGLTTPEKADAPDIAHLLGVPMRTEAVLASLRLKVAAISAFRVGTILRTTRPAGEPLDLLVNSALIAAAEVCPQGQKLALRIVELHGSE